METGSQGTSAATAEATQPELFVGRRRELAELRAGLGEAIAGRGRLFLISGDPGIGKTRLAEEVAVEAMRRNARVLWGRCREGALAFWPWLQVIRSYVRDCDPKILAAQLGSGGGHVAEIVPEIA